MRGGAHFADGRRSFGNNFDQGGPDIDKRLRYCDAQNVISVVISTLLIAFTVREKSVPI